MTRAKTSKAITLPMDADRAEVEAHRENDRGDGGEIADGRLPRSR